MVQSLVAEARARLGEPEALGQSFADLGYVTRFRVIGPFDNEGKAGFDTETPPEPIQIVSGRALSAYTKVSARPQAFSRGRMIAPNET